MLKALSGSISEHDIKSIGGVTIAFLATAAEEAAHAPLLMTHITGICAATFLILKIVKISFEIRRKWLNRNKDSQDLDEMD